MSDTITSTYKLTRQEMLDALRKRDGDNCQHPKCGKPLDFSITEGKFEATIDHWMPQYWCKDKHWTQEETWALPNLKLMHKHCNASKGDLIPNDDGTLPEKITRKFRYRRDKRAGRAELCDQCDNGHNLFVGEYCASCGCNAQRFPRYAKVRYPDCDHEVTWCWLCSITPEMRPSSVGIAMRQGSSGEVSEEEYFIDEDE